MAAKIFPSLTYRCENLLDGSIKRITYLLGHFINDGIRIDKFKVLSSIGGSGPSILLVTLMLSTLESSINQSMEFIILEETIKDN